MAIPHLLLLQLTAMSVCVFISRFAKRKMDMVTLCVNYTLCFDLYLLISVVTLFIFQPHWIFFYYKLQLIFLPYVERAEVTPDCRAD